MCCVVEDHDCHEAAPEYGSWVVLVMRSELHLLIMSKSCLAMVLLDTVRGRQFFLPVKSKHLAFARGRQGRTLQLSGSFD